MSPQVCHTGVLCWHGASVRWRLRWASSYILTQLLSSQGTFLDQNPWERGGTSAMSYSMLQMEICHLAAYLIFSYHFV